MYSIPLLLFLSVGANATVSILGGGDGTDNTKVAKAGDTMTGQLTLAGSTLTVQGNAFSVGTATLTVKNGFVGIGITNPAVTLDLTLQSTNPTLKLRNNTTTDQLIIRTASGGVEIGSINSTDIHFISGSGTRVITLDAGTNNIGIGTVNPASKLHLSSGVFRNDGTGSVPSGFALCYAAGGAQGHCTSVVGAGGGCTCSSP